MTLNHELLCLFFCRKRVEKESMRGVIYVRFESDKYLMVETKTIIFGVFSKKVEKEYSMRRVIYVRLIVINIVDGIETKTIIFRNIVFPKKVDNRVFHNEEKQ